MNEWLFRGRVHRRLHSALEQVLSSLVSVVSVTGSDRWPNYVDYLAERGNFVPQKWRRVGPLSSPPARQSLPSGGPVGVSARPATRYAALSAPARRSSGDKRARDATSTSSLVAKSPDEQLQEFRDHTPAGHSVPWVIEHCDEARTDDFCPYCGPGKRHFLARCSAHSEYKRAGGRMLPGVSSWPTGTSLKQFLSSN
jgi:hypothetical protein